MACARISLFIVFLAGLLNAADEPKWITVEGYAMRASFVAVAGDRIGLLYEGKPLSVPLNRLSPASQEQARQLAQTAPKAAGPAAGPGASPSAATAKRSYYFDPATFRHVVVTEGEANAVEVLFYGSTGGWFFRWEGDGLRKPAAGPKNRESELRFSQVVGEGGERGTAFTGIDRESKLEIRFAEGEREPQDAGINGLYERISPEKAVTLAKKEFKTADEALEETLRSAPRNWPSGDRRMAGEWENRWPVLRANWVKLIFPPVAFAAPAETKMLEAYADYWIAHLEATGMGVGLIGGTVFEQPATETWDGEDDDGFGGHVSLRSAAERAMSFTLSCARGHGLEPESADLSGRIPGTSVRQEAGAS